METDTKNRRGRPRKFEFSTYSMFSDMEKRPVQNLMYASKALLHLCPERDPFFVTEKGNIRRKGIIEQIGRMYVDGTITADQGRELIEQCKTDYNDGHSVKEITDALRKLHMTFKD